MHCRQRIARLKAPKEIPATPPKSFNGVSAVAKRAMLAVGRGFEFGHSTAEGIYERNLISISRQLLLLSRIGTVRAVAASHLAKPLPHVASLSGRMNTSN